MSARARLTDPETSHAAAASVGDLRRTQYAVLKMLRKRPTTGFTDEELVDAYQHVMLDHFTAYPLQSASGIRTRRSELVRLGLVEYASFTRPMSTGRQARVWCVTEK